MSNKANDLTNAVYEKGIEKIISIAIDSKYIKSCSICNGLHYKEKRLASELKRKELFALPKFYETLAEKPVFWTTFLSLIKKDSNCISH